MHGFKPDILDLGEQLRDAPSLEQAWSALDRRLKNYGISNAFYSFVPPCAPERIGEELIYLHSYEDAFIEAYDEIIRDELDWSISYCRDYQEPQRWADPQTLLEVAHLSPRQLQVEHMAWDFGIHEGYLVPLRDAMGPGWGGVGLGARDVAHREFGRILGNWYADLEQMCLLFHSVVRDRGLWGPGVALTERERECLLWAAAGHPAKVIADRLNLRDETVTAHLAHARRKLNARNTTHAVAKGLTLGILQP